MLLTFVVLGFLAFLVLAFVLTFLVAFLDFFALFVADGEPRPRFVGIEVCFERDRHDR